jgi:hypothetical protein
MNMVFSMYFYKKNNIIILFSMYFYFFYRHMTKSLSIDSYDVAQQILDISAKNMDREMAIVGGGKVLQDTRFALQYVLEYEWAQKQQWQVSMTTTVQEQTNKKLTEQWYVPIAQWHQHLEKYNHVHDFSEQDQISIKKQEEPIHILLQRLETGDVRLKAVDTNMKPVKLIVFWRSMDIATIFSDASMIQEYKQAS